MVGLPLRTNQWLAWVSCHTRRPPYIVYLLAKQCMEVQPRYCWLSGKKLGFHETFVKLSTTLVEAVPSTASLERSFSTLGTTYEKCGANWVLKEPENWRFYSNKWINRICILYNKQTQILPNNMIFSVYQTVLLVIFEFTKRLTNPVGR